MKTVVSFKQVHDRSPEPFVMEGRVPLNKVAEELQLHIAKIAHTALHRVRITTTGRDAGQVHIILGPFVIEGHVTYQGPPTRT